VDGATVLRLATCAALGVPFEGTGVPASAAAQRLYAQLQAEVAALPPGAVVDIPAE
jgi:hypothetical protein